MKIFTRSALAAAFVLSFVLNFYTPGVAHAATTPSLGLASSYAVLGSTYTNTTLGTTINGDVGFTTGPAMVPAGTHTNYGSAVPYADAIVDQGTALASLASQPCTFTFEPGAIDLSTDITHGDVGVYTPGVYCSTGAMDIGGPLTLNGSGTFIFRPVGAFTSTAGAIITLTGDSACDVFWTPTQATTLAANTNFAGTIIADAGITVGANTTWTGRALAAGGTVTTDTTTITAPTCADSTPVLATLNVIKIVVNENGGTAVASDFNLYVKNEGVNVAGSPAAGTGALGTSYSLLAGTYVVSEDSNSLYTQSYSGDCDPDGNITLSEGDAKTCTITNTDIPTPDTGGGARDVDDEVVEEEVIVEETDDEEEEVTPEIITVEPTETPVINNVSVPSFPDTGFPPAEDNNSWYIAVMFFTFIIFPFFVAVLKKIRI